MEHTIQFRGKRCLVTGGAGFIGSNTALKLVECGAEVTVLDSLVPGLGGNPFNLETIKDRIRFLRSDMGSHDAISEAVSGKDFIFNLAGNVSHQDSMSNPLLDLEINVRAQVQLLEACRRIIPQTPIVFASTRQIYGPPEYLPVNEDHPIRPVDVNGINKYAGEQYHSLYAKVYGLKTVSLRLTNTYGPRQLIKHSRQGFIGWFINRALTGNKIQLFGTGEQVRDINYVDDVVDALLKAVTTQACYGGVFNLSGEQASLKSIAQTLLKVEGNSFLELSPFPDHLKKIDIGDYYGSSDKFQDLTSWTPQVPLQKGLIQTVNYFKQHKSHYLES